MPRPHMFTPMEVAQIVTWKANGLTNIEIAARMGCHRNTISGVFKRIREEKEPRKLQPCGSHGAYWRHIRKGEEPCFPCKLAHSRDNEERQKNDPLHKEKRKRWNAARYAKAQSESSSSGVPVRALITAARSSREN